MTWLRQNLWIIPIFWTMIWLYVQRLLSRFYRKRMFLNTISHSSSINSINMIILCKSKILKNPTIYIFSKILRRRNNAKMPLFFWPLADRCQRRFSRNCSYWRVFHLRGKWRKSRQAGIIDSCIFGVHFGRLFVRAEIVQSGLEEALLPEGKTIGVKIFQKWLESKLLEKEIIFAPFSFQRVFFYKST